MRLVVPVPERARPDVLLLASAALLIGQLITGTGTLYALLIFLFCMACGLTFNALGGFRTIPGTCVLLIGLKIVIVSQVAKVVFGQPADDFLRAPVTTAAMLMLGMTGTLCVALLLPPAHTVSPWMRPVHDADLLNGIALVAYVLGLFSYLYLRLYGANVETGEVNIGSLLGIARQVQVLWPLAIVAATAQRIVATGGRGSFGPLVAVAVGTQFLVGLLGTSKSMIFGSVLTYVLTCVAFRFAFRRVHLTTLAAFAVVGVVVLYPLAQIGRHTITSFSLAENIRLARELAGNISSLEDWRNLRESLDIVTMEHTADHLYYGRNMGLLDRLSLIEQADALVQATHEQGPSGWKTITHGFEMTLPRVLYPEKPIYNTGNFLGHRIGSIWEHDESTQVSFGIIAEAYTAFEWLGAALLPMLLMAGFFLVYGKLTGDIIGNIWTVFLLSRLQHDIVEATISAMILLLLQLPLVLLALCFGVLKASQAVAALLRYTRAYG